MVEWAIERHEARLMDHLQNGESNVVLVADQSKIVGHPVDGGVCNVDPIQISEEVQRNEDGNNPYIDPPHQRRLVDVRAHDRLGDQVSIADWSELPLSRWSW